MDPIRRENRNKKNKTLELRWENKGHKKCIIDFITVDEIEWLLQSLNNNYTEFKGNHTKKVKRLKYDMIVKNTNRIKIKTFI